MKTPLWKPILLSLALICVGVGGTYLLIQNKTSPPPPSPAKPSVAEKVAVTPVPEKTTLPPPSPAKRQVSVKPAETPVPNKKATPPRPSSTKPSMTAKAADTLVLTVNELATNPSAHIGALQLIGVVATVESEKQFILIDESEFRECSTGCLTSAETKKITVRWNGKAPAIEQAVRVTGDLTHTAAGYTFTAREVGMR